MKAIYECSVCGVVTEASEQVCTPRLQEDVHDYCGTTRERAEMCDNMKEHLAYVCGSCGRPAEQAELVCKPLVVA
jgi:hypothetical protein